MKVVFDFKVVYERKYSFWYRFNKIGYLIHKLKGNINMKFENNKNAQVDLNQKVPYITFPILTELSFLKHGFSTKLGGVSSEMFATMNLGSETSPYQDASENIEENYRRIADSIGFDVNSVVVSLQVHKTNILEVNEKDCGKGLFLPRDFDEIDGLITNTPGVTLVTKFADCVPLYFVDPVKRPSAYPIPVGVEP